MAQLIAMQQQMATMNQPAAPPAAAPAAPVQESAAAPETAAEAPAQEPAAAPQQMDMAAMMAELQALRAQLAEQNQAAPAAAPKEQQRGFEDMVKEFSDREENEQ